MRTTKVDRRRAVPSLIDWPIGAVLFLVAVGFLLGMLTATFLFARQ